MNRIFKVLWNHSRNSHVVTDETRRARTKTGGRSAVSAALAAMLALGAASGAWATDIAVSGNWKNNTTVETSGNVHNVYAKYVRDKIGINKFARFDLSKDNIANLHHAADSNALVNFVDAKINIDGTLNSIKDAKVGGELIFVSPNGMTVGTTGVINAGSFTAVAPTQKEYETLSTVGDKGHMINMDAKALERIRTAELPLNPLAAITVNGSIHAGNRIMLAASQITVAKGAVVKSTVTDFADLVNITDAQGEIVTSSGLAAGDFTIVADTQKGSGDVLLVARSETGASVSIGEVKAHAKIDVAGTVDSRESVTAQAVAGSGTYDLAGESEDTQGGSKTRFKANGDHNLSKVTAEVLVSGTVKAAEDVNLTAYAENVLTDSGTFKTAEGLVLQILGSAIPFNEAAAYGKLTGTSRVLVETGASVVAQKGSATLKADTLTAMTIGAKTSAIKLADLLGGALNKIPSAAVVVGLIDGKAETTVKGALTSGADLTLSADNRIEANLSAVSATQNDQSARTAVTVGLIKGEGRVTVDPSAALTMAGSGAVTISAKQRNRIETSAEVAAQWASNGGLAFNYTQADTSAEASVASGLASGNKPASVVIEAVNDTERYQATSANLVKVWGLLPLLSQSVAAAGNDFVAGLMGVAAQGIDPNFTAPNFRLGGSVTVVTGGQRSDVTVGGNWHSASDIDVTSTARIYDHLYQAVSGVETSDKDGQTGSTKGQGSLALLVQTPGSAEAVLSSNLTVLDNAQIVVDDGNLRLANNANIDWHRLDAMKEDLQRAVDELKSIYTAASNNPAVDKSKLKQQWEKVDKQAGDLKEAFDKVGSSDLSFGEKLGQLGTGLHELSVLIADFLSLAKVAGEGTVTDIVGILKNSFAFIVPSNYVNAYVAASATGTSDAKLSAAGAVGVLLQDTSSTLTVGKNTLLQAQGTIGGTQQEPVYKGQVTLATNSVNESVVLGGHIKDLFGFPLPATDDASAVGASVMWQSLKSNNTLTVREAAQIDAGSTAALIASDRIYGLTIGASADITKGSLGLDVLLAIANVKGSNTVDLDDETYVEGDTVFILGSRNDDVQTIAGAVEVTAGDGASTSAAAGVAVNTGRLDNVVRIADNDGQKSEYTVAGAGLRSTFDGSGKDHDVEGLWQARQGSVTVLADTDVAMNAVGVAGGVAVSGKDDPEPPQDEATMNVVAKWFAQTKGKVTQFGDKMLSEIDALAESFPKAMHEFGQTLSGKVNNTLSENSSTSTALSQNEEQSPSDVDGSQIGSETNATTQDESTTQFQDTESAARFQLAAAGSVGWNAVDAGSSVVIELADFTMDAAEVDVNSVTDKWVGAWAGSAGINFVRKNNTVSNAVGIAGAVAGNSGSFTSSVSIGKAAQGGPGLTLGEQVKDVDIYAINDGTIIAEGLAVAVVKGGDGTNNWAFDANVSADLVRTTTSAVVSDAAFAESASGYSWDQAAWTGDTQVTGGTGFGLTTASQTGRNATFGLIVSVADLDNTVTSTLSNAKFGAAHAVDVRALASLVQVNTAVSVQVALGDSSLAFSGSALSSALKNTVHASVSDSSVTLAGANARMQIAARTANSDEHKAFDAITDVDFYPGVDISGEIDNSSYYKAVGLYTDKDKTQSQTLDDFAEGANMVQTSVAVSVGASGEDNAAGAGIAVSRIDNTFEASSSSLTLREAAGTTSEFQQTAHSGAVSVTVAAGAAGGGAGSAVHFSAAGSVVVSNVDQDAVVSAEGLVSGVDVNTIKAENNATTVNVAGNVGVSLGSGNALGAAVVVMNTDNGASVTINRSAFTAASKLSAEAHNRASAWGASVDAMVAGNMAMGGAVTVNRSLNETLVQVEGATLTGVGSAEFKASDETALWTLAGNVAVSTKEEGAGVSGAVGYALSGRDKSEGTKVSVNNLTVNEGAAGSLTGVTVKADANDHVSSLVISAGASGGVLGFGGVASVNEIKRKVSAELTNLKTEAGKRTVSSLAVQAVEEADIDNLALVAGASQMAGVGLGVAVNRVSSTTAAALKNSEFQAASVRVESKADNDIDTIGIGGAGAGNTGVVGSVSVNLITNRVNTDVSGAHIDVSDWAAVNAQSDDTIGVYTGEASGGGTAGAGLSVTVNEKKGETKTTVSESTITEHGGASTTTVAAGVADDDINNSIVNNVGTAASLADKRKTETVDGIWIGATGTETYKTFVINGSGAGSAAVNGTTSVTYHGGATGVDVKNTTLSAKGNVSISAGDYANVDTVATTVSGAGTVAVPIAVNVLTTEHTTSTSVAGGSIAGSTVSIGSEAKEGASGLSLDGGGAGSVAIGALVNVTRELSDVSTTVDGVNSVTAGVYNQTAGYLGRITTLGVSAAGAVNAGGAAAVSVNYGNNTVSNTLSKSRLEVTDSVTIDALRKTDWSGVQVNAAGAAYGAVAATVLVNTAEGASNVLLDGSTITGQGDGQASVTLGSRGEDHYKLTAVTASGAIGAGGAGVVVNRYYGDATMRVNASEITGSDVQIGSASDRFINVTNVLATGGVGALGANVVASYIGTDDDDTVFADLGIKDTKDKVDKYQSDYGASSDGSDPGSLSGLMGAVEGILSEDEQQSMLAAAAVAAESADKKAGTSTTVTGSNIAASKTLAITAKEDAAEGAGTKVTVGSGEIGGGILAASVATLRTHNNATVEVAGGALKASSATIGAYIGGNDLIEVWQTSAALASGTAGYGDAAYSGSGSVSVSDTLLTSTDATGTTVQAENKAKRRVEANGIVIGVATGGGMVSDLRDSSSVAVQATGLTAAGNTALRALRGQQLSTETLVGQGGLVNGSGSIAKVRDTGESRVKLDGIGMSGKSDSLTVSADDRVCDSALGFGASVSGLGIAVVQASVEKGGKTEAVVTNADVQGAEVEVSAEGGTDTGKDEDNMRLSATTKAFGGSVTLDMAYNSARVDNTHEVKASLEKSTFSADTDVTVSADTSVIYNVLAAAGHGGAVSTGNNRAEVRHASHVTAFADLTSDTGELIVSAHNREKATVRSESAGGGLLVGEGASIGGNPAETVHRNTGSAEASVAGDITVSGDATISAQTEVDGKFAADNTKGALLGGSGASLDNTVETTNTAKVAAGAELSVLDNLTAQAGTVSTLGADGGDWAVDSGIYGAIIGTGIKLNNTENNTNAVTIGEGAQLSAGHDLTLESVVVRETDLRSRARSAGAFAGVTAYATHTITSLNTVDVASGAFLKTIDVEGLLTLAASADETIHAEAVADLQGAAAGGSGASVTMTLKRTDEVNVTEKAGLEAGGDAQLFAGRNAQGEDARLDLTSYSHAYGKAFIAGTDTTLKDSMTFANRINVAGAVHAQRGIEGVAHDGEVQTREMARFYHWTTTNDAAKEYQVASSAAGQRSTHFAPSDNTITVSGEVVAGYATSSDITISGVYVPEGANYTIEGSSSTLTVEQQGENGTVSIGHEDVANVYWERHNAIQTLLSEYGANAGDEDRKMMVALKAEDEFLLATMQSRGLAKQDDKGRWSLTGSLPRDYVLVEDVTVSGGNIDFTAGLVTGTGTIKANAAEHITITNTSNLALHVQNVQILEKGGTVTMNGAQVSAIDGFKGSLTSSGNAADPTMTIKSQAEPSKVTVVGKGDDGRPVESVRTPDTSLTICGELGNKAGGVEIDVAGDIDVASEADVFAAGGLQMHATGSVTQSYHPGIFNVSGEGSVEALWKNESQDYYSQFQEAVAQGKTPGNASHTGQRNATGAIVAGGNIFIAGQVVNLNGTVQSGFAHYGIDISGQELEAAIAAVKSQWEASGRPDVVNPKSSLYEISRGGYVARDDGTYAWQVAAWYDPVNDRVTIDDVRPEGGRIYITGTVANTGGGRLLVLDGCADVTVKTGSHGLVTGDIDTGMATGSIRITDTGYFDAGKGIRTRVTEYRKNEAGELVTDTYDETAEGKSNVTTTQGWSGYAPRQGMYYTWSDGYGSTTVTVKEHSQRFTVWNAFNWGDPKDWAVGKTIVKDKEELSSAGTVGVMNPGIAGDFVIWTDRKENSETPWVYEHWTKYDNWTHFSGVHYAQGTQTTSNTYVVTYAAKADRAVDVGTLSGQNRIELESGADIGLGGSVRADGGSVNLTAAGDIFNCAGTAGIYGAAEVTLKAGGSIGAAESAVRIADAGNAALKAEAQGSIHLDASNLHQGAVLRAESIQAGGDVEIRARNDLNIGSISGTDMALTSVEGSITVENLSQKANVDGTQRFDATAANGNVVLTSVAGDIGIGVIEAQNVEITASGGISDAIDRTGRDDITAEDKIQAWIEAGILAADGSDSGETRYKHDYDATVAGIKAEWTEYKSYQKQAGDGLGAMQSRYEQLSAQFAGFESVEAYVAAQKADSGTTLGRIEAAHLAGDYGWSQNELLFAVAESIINPDAGSTPKSGEANIIAKTVKLAAGAGSVGSSEGVLSGSFADLDLNAETGQALYKALARADVNDVVWDFEKGTVTVQTKRPLIIQSESQDGRIDASAPQGDVYLQSSDDAALRIGTIAARDAVRLVSANGIYNAAADASVSGTYVTLRGGSRSVGTENSAVVVHQNRGGWLSVSAAENVHVSSPEELTIYSAASNGTISIAAAGVASYGGSADGEQTDVNVEHLGYVNAPDLRLDTTGHVGAAGQALRVAADGTVTLVHDVAGLNLQTVGSGTLTLKTLEADGRLDAANYLTVAADSLTLAASSAGSQGAVSLTAAHRLNLAGVEAIEAGGALSLEAETLEGASGVRLAAGSIDVDVVGDVQLGALKALGDVTVAAETGAVSTQAIESTAGAVSVSGVGDVSTGGAVKAAQGVKLVSSQGNAALGSVTTDNGDVQVSAAGTVSVQEGSTLTAEAGSVTLAASRVDLASNVAVRALTLAWTSKEDIALRDVSLSTSGGDLSLRSTEGKVLLEGSTLSSAASVSIDAKGDVSAHGSKIAAEKNLTVASKAGGVDLSGLTGKLMTLESLAVTAAAGIDLSSLSFAVYGDTRIAGASIDLNGSALQTGGALSLEAREAGLDLTQTAQSSNFKAGSVDIHARGNVLFKESETIAATAAGGAVTIVSDEGRISAVEAALAANGALKLDAAGDIDLRDANRTDNGLVYNAERIDIAAGGAFIVGETALRMTSTKGGVVVRVGSIDWAADSRITSAADIDIAASETLRVGQGLTMQAAGSIDLTGGQKTFALETGATLTAQNGHIFVVGAGDAAFGGAMTVDAGSTTQDAASVTIGAEGVLHVDDDAFTVTAQNGSVRIFGGSGMNIRNDLTIVTSHDALLTSSSGNIGIGNDAEIRAGTESGLAGKLYGAVDIDAGGTISIGESAVIYADDLSVTASGDITFGDKATLHGTADGVRVVSEAGSIHMGSDLDVVSDHEMTLFKARQGDIVIGQAAKLDSLENTIVFNAGRDIRFEDDFTASSRGLQLEAGNRIEVRDNADITTVATENTPQFDTHITADGGVRFGNNATLTTTDLVILAGTLEEDSSADVVFGDNSCIQTSLYGIVVDASGDIVYGSNAFFATGRNNADAEIHLDAGGSIRLGAGAGLEGADRIELAAKSGVTLGAGSKIIDRLQDGSTQKGSRVSVTTAAGDIVFDKSALIAGNQVHIAANDADGGQGGSVVLSEGASIVVHNGGLIRLEAYEDIEVLDDFSAHTEGEFAMQTGSGDIVVHNGAVLASTGDITMESAGAIAVGDDALILTSTIGSQMGHDDVTMKAVGDITFGYGTQMESDANISIESEKGDVVFGNNTTVGVVEDEDGGTFAVVSRSGSITMGLRTNLYGEKSATIEAAGDVTVNAKGGDSWIDSDRLVQITSHEGNVNLTGGVWVGGFDVDTNLATENVVLSAAGTVAQRDVNGEAGISARQIEVSAGGDVYLGAAGNNIDAVAVQSGRDIVLGLGGVDSRISLNPETDGVVVGDLVVSSPDSALRFTDETIEVAGDAKFEGARFEAQSVTAAGDVEIVASGAHSAILVGTVRGRDVTAATDSGSISIERVEAAGSAGFYRLDGGTTNDIALGTVSALDRVIVVSAGGRVGAHGISAQNGIVIFAEGPGAVDRTAAMDGGTNGTAVFENAGRTVASFIGLPSGEQMDASYWLIHPMVPDTSWIAALMRTAPATVSRVLVHPYDDVMVPAGRFFFLDRRAEPKDEDTGLARPVESVVNNLWVYNDTRPEALDSLLMR